MLLSPFFLQPTSSTAFEPALSHQVAFFLFSLLLYLSHTVNLSNKLLLIIGIVSGFFIITRLPDTFLLLAPFTILFMRIKKPIAISSMLIIIGGSCVGLLSQLWVQWQLFGSPFVNPYLTGNQGRFTFNLISLTAPLLSVERGLFTWTPVLLLTLYGLWSSRKKKKLKVEAWVGLVTFTLFSLYIGLWNGGLSAGYGNRLFFSTLPFFALGMAWVLKKLSLRSRMALIGMFAMWNILLLGQFFFDGKRLVLGEGLTLTNFISGQFTVNAQIIDTFIQHGLRETLENATL